MNKIFQIRISIAIILFTILSFSAGAAQYYVVIGAFSKESNARKYTSYARNHSLDAYYKFNPEVNLYYVHVMHSSRKEEARNWALYIQHETKFKDAWIFSDPTGEESSLTQADVAQRGTQPRHKSNQIFADLGPVALTENYSGNVSEYLSESSKAATSIAWTDIEEISYISGIKNAMNFKNLPGETSKLVTFIAETSEGKTISTEVILVNYEKARKLSSFRTGEYVAFRGNKRNQKLTIVCDVFGYSEQMRTLNLDNLKMSRDIKQNKDGVWEVRFKLNRLKENEISIMYNTVFYQDAAVLQPSSKKQVDELLSLMMAHPNYKILLHSHCNSGSKRVIKTPGKNSYFNLEGSLEKTASDKQLTKQRAKTLRTYLVDNGIDSKRIAVLGWGSMDMLVKPNSADAAINERIEMEILEN